MSMGPFRPPPPPRGPVIPPLPPGMMDHVDPAAWAALEKRLAAAESRLTELTDDPDSPWVYERVYPVDIALPLFTGTATGGGYPSMQGTLNIDKGGTFFALGLEAFYTVTGLLTEDDSAATLTIPETLRPLIFDYNWLIQDDGHDRPWGNIPLPSPIIRSANIGDIGFGAQGKCRAGAKVMFTVNPIFFNSTSTATGLKTFTSHSLQFVLSGIMLRDGVL